MTTEQLLLETLRQEVLDFAQFLAERRTAQPLPTQPATQTSPLGERLQAIRDQIIESGISLLTYEGVEQEIHNRRLG